MEEILGVKISCDGNLHEQIYRRERLFFVAGYVLAQAGTLQFLNSLHDRKGLLTAHINGHHFALEAAIQNAWNNAGEDAVEFIVERPMEPWEWDRCKACDKRFFCDDK